MTNEIQTLDKTQPLPFVVKAMETLEGLKTLGVAVLGAKMAPKHFYEAGDFGKPDYNNPKIGVFIAVVMHGHELGLSMSAAMQDIVPVHGRMSIMGDAAKALVFSSGLVEDFTETITGSIQTEDYSVTYYTKRKDGREFTRSFSVAEAKRAALWVPETAEAKHKLGAWYKYPARMIMYRALGFILRDAYPEPLKGTSVYEEMINATETIDQEAEVISSKTNGGEKIADNIVANIRKAKEEKEAVKKEEPTPIDAPIDAILKRLGLDKKANGFIIEDEDLPKKLKLIHNESGDEGLVDYINSLSHIVVEAVKSEKEINDFAKPADTENDFPLIVNEVKIDTETGESIGERGPKDIGEIRKFYAQHGLTKDNWQDIHKAAGVSQYTSNIDLCTYGTIKQLTSVYQELLKLKK